MPSGLEAFFIDLDAGGCNMTFHFYLELDRKPDVSLLRDAMRHMMSAHEGMNMRYHRHAWYVSSHTHDCPVIDVEGEDLSSYTPCRLDYRQNTVDLKVLHATRSDTWYLCFDFFHGVVDGRSGMQFVYDFFDVLNKREGLAPHFTLRVSELVHSKDRPARQSTRPAFTVFPQCVPFRWSIGGRGEDKTRMLCHRGRLQGVSARYADLVGRLFGDKSAKMIIPVDVRRHARQQDTAMYGNLFVPLLVDTAKYPSWTDIHSEILSFVKQKPRLMALAEKLDLYARFPVGLRRAVIRGAIPLVMAQKKFIYCALVSALGTVDSERLTCECFAVKDYSVSFVSFPFAAFTVISLQYEGHTNTTVSWHSGRVPEEAVNTLVDQINECMNTQVVYG